MRRIIVWLLSTLTTVVLLFSYRTSTMGAGAAATTGAVPVMKGGSTGGTRYNGAVVETRWGDIKVSITVARGKITGVAVPVYPFTNGRDRLINARALPVLIEATLTAQSADIDTVSGATDTSEGYKLSLRAALDAARLS